MPVRDAMFAQFGEIGTDDGFPPALLRIVFALVLQVDSLGGIKATEERVTAIYNKAKQSDRLLTTQEVLEAIHVPTIRDRRNVI